MLTCDNEIRSLPAQKCSLCGAVGEVIHSGLTDEAFGAMGKWDIRKCSDSGCGLLWVDPLPVPEDLHKAYSCYYTHDNTSSSQSLLRRVYEASMGGYFRQKLGYTVGTGPAWHRLFAPLLYLHPAGPAGLETRAMYAHAPKEGARLLDIGCGSGRLVASMQKLGWAAEGIDVDPKAVEAARAMGLKVGHGTLSSQSFSDNSFDVVHLCHVIEHVYDASELLAECRRILKPGGLLVLIAPNPASLTYRWFKENWFQLDPPRHLYVYNANNLSKLAGCAGLSIERLFSTARCGNQSWMFSRRKARTGRVGISEGDNVLLRLCGIVYQYAMRAFITISSLSGEEIVLLARKP